MASVTGAAPPVKALRSSSLTIRARLVTGDDLRDFTGGAAPITYATARSAPRPPPDLFRW